MTIVKDAFNSFGKFDHILRRRILDLNDSRNFQAWKL